MSIVNSKFLSGFLVAIGVGLCATFGAQLTPQTMNSLSQELAKGMAQSEEVDKGKTKVEEPIQRLSSWWSISALPFSSGVILIIFGSLLARKQQNLELEETPTGESNEGIVNLEQTLIEINQALTSTLQLFEEKELDSTSLLTKVKADIEMIQAQFLEPIVEQRDRLKLKMGTSQFIDVFGPIASGERKLNRAWAACVDLHQTETRCSLSQANEAFATALNLNTQQNS